MQERSSLSQLSSLLTRAQSLSWCLMGNPSLTSLNEHLYYIMAPRATTHLSISFPFVSVCHSSGLQLLLRSRNEDGKSQFLLLVASVLSYLRSWFLLSTGEAVFTRSGVQSSFSRHQGGARTPHPGPPQVLHLTCLFTSLRPNQNPSFLSLITFLILSNPQPTHKLCV